MSPAPQRGPQDWQVSRRSARLAERGEGETEASSPGRAGLWQALAEASLSQPLLPQSLGSVARREEQRSVLGASLGEEPQFHPSPPPVL